MLRLFIDRPGRDPMSKEGGIGLEECAKVSHAVETALDVEDLIPHAVRPGGLQPGPQPAAPEPEHFAKVVGKKVKVKTFGPIGEPPRKNFTGTLAQVGRGRTSPCEVEGGGRVPHPLQGHRQGEPRVRVLSSHIQAP